MIEAERQSDDARLRAGMAISPGSAVLRASGVVVDRGVVAILDRASVSILGALEAEGATPLRDDLIAVDTEDGSVLARADDETLPLRAVIVLDRGEAFTVARSHDALTLLDATVGAGARGPEHLERQLGTCMAITRAAAVLEAQVPDGMAASEIARRLLAAL